MKKVVSLLITRSLGSLSQFITNIILSRILGPIGVGTYFLYFSWLNILGNAYSLGLNTYALKKVAENRSRRFISKLISISLVVSGALTVFVFMFDDTLARILFKDLSFDYLLRFASLSAILFAVLKIVAESLKSLLRPNLALTIEFTTTNIVYLSIIIAFSIFGKFNALHSVQFYFVAIIFATMFGLLTLFRELCTSNADTRVNWRSLFSFWGITIINNMQAYAPYILLPYFSETSQIGQFGAAHKLVALSATIFTALESNFAPSFASTAEKTRLKNYHKSRLWSIILYLPIFTIFLVGGKTILLIYGDEFMLAYPLLIIIGSGRLMTAICGLTESYLKMAGMELYELVISVFSLLTFSGCAIVLGKAIGTTGIAISYSLSIALRASISFIVVKLKS